MKQTKQEPTPRILERDIVYAMRTVVHRRSEAEVWSEGREPAVADFADPRWAVVESTVKGELAVMDGFQRVYLEEGAHFPQWYLLNGAVYTARSFYLYVKAFYPPLEGGAWAETPMAWVSPAHAGLWHLHLQNLSDHIKTKTKK